MSIEESTYRYGWASYVIDNVLVDLSSMTEESLGDRRLSIPTVRYLTPFYASVIEPRNFSRLEGDYVKFKTFLGDAYCFAGKWAGLCYVVKGSFSDYTLPYLDLGHGRVSFVTEEILNKMCRVPDVEVRKSDDYTGSCGCDGYDTFYDYFPVRIDVVGGTDENRKYGNELIQNIVDNYQTELHKLPSIVSYLRETLRLTVRLGEPTEDWDKSRKLDVTSVTCYYLYRYTNVETAGSDDHLPYLNFKDTVLYFNSENDRRVVSDWILRNIASGIVWLPEDMEIKELLNEIITLKTLGLLPSIDN